MANRVASRKKQDKPQAERRNVGRARLHDPDPNTENGQWAWWVRYHMPTDATGAELGEGAGKNRSAGFRWLAGESVPSLETWTAIAKWLGLPARWQSLVPPAEFVTYVKRFKALPSDNRFKAGSE